MASRRKREFFEAFQSSEDSVGGEPSRGAVRKGLVSDRGMTGPPGVYSPAVYSFTREKLAGIGVLVVALIVGAFLLGLVVGGRGRPAVPSAAAPEGAGGALKGVGPDATGPEAAGGQPEKVLYRLRIISGITKSSAQELRKFLNEQGYGDDQIGFKEDRGRYIGYVGTFDSQNSPKAQALLEKFQSMQYQGGTPFKSCYFVEMTRKND